MRSPGVRPLRAATYNLHGCVGVDGRCAPDRVGAVIGELDADVVGLQEVDDRRPQHNGFRQFEFLQAASGLTAVAGPNVRDHQGDYGNALLTRLPVAAVRHIDLSLRGRERRGAIDVDLVSPHGALRVVVTHFGLGLRERRAQVGMLLDALGHAPHAEHHREATLLLGDLNEWMPGGGARLHALGRRFAAHYTGRSWPAFLPLLRLERIYAHPRPAQVKIRVHASRLARRASDHLPLVVDLVWPGSCTHAPAPRLAEAGT